MNGITQMIVDRISDGSEASWEEAQAMLKNKPTLIQATMDELDVIGDFWNRVCVQEWRMDGLI